MSEAWYGGRRVSEAMDEAELEILSNLNGRKQEVSYITPALDLLGRASDVWLGGCWLVCW